MKHYHVVDGEYLGQWGSYASPKELASYAETFGSALVAGLPEGFDQSRPPTERSRWHLKRMTWEELPVPVHQQWDVIRYQRDKRLQACDWRILPDSPTPAEDRDAWLAYRQALRDITDQPDPAAIAWPTPPA